MCVCVGRCMREESKKSKGWRALPDSLLNMISKIREDRLSSASLSWQNYFPTSRWIRLPAEITRKLVADKGIQGSK
jgi:hypothetical protein